MAAEIHVRSVRLDAGPRRLAVLRAHLTDAEREREERLLRPGSRDRFVAARGWLREALAERLGLSPGDVPIERGPNGKPRLHRSADAGDLRFNVSHSGDWALLALADGCEVGADIERREPRRDLAALARRVLAPSELAAWEATADDAARADRFFAIWSRKEAYAKGLGEGLGLVMRDHALQPAGDARRWVVSGGGDWIVADVDAPAGYAAAVAAADAGCRIDQAPAASLDR
jgi:4'-phosphopantetheinyl transferase